MIPGFKLRLFHVTLNLSLANEYVSDVTMSTQVIKYNQNFSSGGSANQIAVLKSS